MLSHPATAPLAASVLLLEGNAVEEDLAVAAAASGLADDALSSARSASKSLQIIGFTSHTGENCVS